MIIFILPKTKRKANCFKRTNGRTDMVAYTFTGVANNATEMIHITNSCSYSHLDFEFEQYLCQKYFRAFFHFYAKTTHFVITSKMRKINHAVMGLGSLAFRINDKERGIKIQHACNSIIIHLKRRLLTSHNRLSSQSSSLSWLSLRSGVSVVVVVVVVVNVVVFFACVAA